MPRFAFTLEDDRAVWTTAEADCCDEDTACAFAIQLCSRLFAAMHDDDAPDWSRCRVRVAVASGPVILVSSAAEAAQVERDLWRSDELTRTDH